MPQSSKKAISYSQLSKYETCPKQYYHTTIRKDFKESFGEAAEAGKKVHKALELYIGKGKPLPSELRHLGEENIITKFKQIADSGRAEILVEQQLAITEDFQPTSWFGKNVWFRAIIDLAIIRGERVTIVDYKTGKRRTPLDMSQLEICAAILSLVRPELTTFEVGFVWTTQKCKLDRTFLAKDDMKRVWNDVMPRDARLQHAVLHTEFPPEPSGLCKKHCPVTTCPHNGE